MFLKSVMLASCSVFLGLISSGTAGRAAAQAVAPPPAAPYVSVIDDAGGLAGPRGELLAFRAHCYRQRKKSRLKKVKCIFSSG